MPIVQLPGATNEEGSDNWGSGFLADAVSLFVWACVVLAVLVALIVLLQSFGRRRAAERDTD